MVRTTGILAALVAVSALLHAQEGEVIDSLVVEALRSNPIVLAEAQRVLAASERQDQAGTLDPPLFIYKLMEFPGTEFSQARFQNFGIMQNIRFPTKLARESDIAQAERARASLQERANILNVVSQVKSSAAMLRGTRTMLEISRQNQRLLRQILSAAQTRYSVGRTSQQDVLKSDIELTRLESQEIDFEQRVEASEAELRALLNRPASHPIGPLEEVPAEPLAVSIVELLELARIHSPALAADSVRVTQAISALSLRNHEYYPDVSLELERVTMPVGGPSSWTVMATISLPFAPWTLGRLSSGVEEARAEKAESESRYVASATSLEATVRKIYARARALSYQLEAYRDRIVPRTEQSVQSLLTAYQTGVTDFLMLMDGYRTFHDARMELTRIAAEYHQTLAELEREVGVTALTRPLGSEEKRP